MKLVRFRTDREFPVVEGPYDARAYDYTCPVPDNDITFLLSDKVIDENPGCWCIYWGRDADSKIFYKATRKLVDELITPNVTYDLCTPAPAWDDDGTPDKSRLLDIVEVCEDQAAEPTVVLDDAAGDAVDTYLTEFMNFFNWYQSAKDAFVVKEANEKKTAKALKKTTGKNTKKTKKQ